jgi:hypothetical protein
LTGRYKYYLPLVVAYLLLMIGRVLTSVPYVDEAWYSMPAWNLEQNDSIGTPSLEPSDSPMPGMDVSLLRVRQHTYWMMPLPLVLQAGWYKIFGYSVFTLRFFSLCWGLVALAAWFVLMRQLFGNSVLPELAVLLIATDGVFMARAPFGRMDIMSAACGFWGIAVYLGYRERNLTRAILVSHSLVALSTLAHPNGGMVSFAALVAVIAYLDWRRIRIPHILLAGAPYAIAGGGMLLYALQDWTAFTAQFFHNTHGRFGFVSNPWDGIVGEFRRYAEFYGFNPNNANLAGHLKIVVVLVYAAAFLAMCLNPKLRPTKYHRTLILIAATSFLALMLVDAYKVQWYLIYPIPPFAALTALCAFELKAHRRVVTVILTIIVLVNVGSVLRLVLRNPYKQSYQPVIAYVKAQRQPNDIVMGSSELGFSLGYEGLDDDLRLGFHSGVRPAIIVVDSRFREAFAAFTQLEPDATSFIHNRLRNEYGVGYRTDEYTVYLLCERLALCAKK